MSLGHGATIVRDGLVLYLDAANEKSYPGSGTTWYDLSGNGNDVTLINNPTYSTNNNGSFIFDGVDEYLSSVSLTHNGTLTAIFVAKYQSKSAYHNFFDRSAADPMLWIRPVDTLELNKSDGAVTTSTYTNEIHSFATISESAGVSTIYVDGAHVITDTQGADSFPNNITITLLNRGGSQTYKGEIFQIMMYGRELTADEITQNFEATRGRFGI